MKEIYQSQTLHLFAGEVTLPNGKKTELDFIKHPGASAVVPLTDKGTVILVHQYRHATGGYLYEIPAGKLSPGETPEACALREVEEEIGYCVSRLQKLSAIFTVPGFCDEVIHIYLGTGLSPSKQNLDEDEIIDVVEWSFEEAMENITNQTIRDAKSIVGLQLAYAEAKRQELLSKRP